MGQEELEGTHVDNRSLVSKMVNGTYVLIDL